MVNDYSDGTFQKNVLYSNSSYKDSKDRYIFYDGLTYYSNKFQLEGITINLTNAENFETSNEDFPQPINPTLNSQDFYDNFVSKNGEFKLRLITTKKSSNTYTGENRCSDYS